jgi:hypothetical protein
VPGTVGTQAKPGWFPLAEKVAPKQRLVDVDRRERADHESRPNLGGADPISSFGISGKGSR